MIKLGNHQIKITHYTQKARKTEVEVYDNDNNLVTLGTAYCSPRDNFSRTVGRKLALRKALTESPMPKGERLLMWEDYIQKWG